MGRLAQFAYDFQHSPLLIVSIIDLLFLFAVLWVFKANYPTELRTVIKDAFIGWNGALALAINVIVKDPSLSTSSTTLSVTQKEEPHDTKS